MEVNWKQAKSYAFMSQTDQCKYGLDFISPYLKKGQKLLDIGCGTGTLTSLIKEKIHPGFILGIDPDLERIQYAQTKYSELSDISFVVCKGSDIDTDGRENQFDIAISNATIHWMDAVEKKLCLENVYKLLKPGSFFLAQFCSCVPKSAVALARFIGQEELGKVETSASIITDKEFGKLAASVGFEVVTFDSSAWSTQFDSFESLCEFHYASTGGLIDFRKAIDKKNKKLNEKYPINWDKRENLVHETNLYRFVLQKV